MVKKILVVIFIIMAGLLAVEGFLYFRMVNYKNNSLAIRERVDPSNIVAPDKPVLENYADRSSENEANKIIPDKIALKVPFTSQAPFGKWDAYHQEACEEASLIMLKYFLDNKQLGSDIAEKEIQDMIAFEIKKYGDYKDSSAQDVVALARDFYGIKNLKVVYDFQKDDLKEYLAKGKPIIVPAAGRLLGNPNFTQPGPLYHNLVLIGYENDTIITNDPGTRKGEKYRYDIDILYGAIHDFEGNLQKIEQGRKAMIVLE